MPRREQKAASAPSALVGVFRTTKRGAYVKTLGAERRMKVGVGDSARQARDGDIVKLSITGEGRRGPVGRVEEILSGNTLVETATLAALAIHDIPMDWNGVRNTAPKRVNAADREGRTDLRALPLVTIDGASARDFDDAVYAEPQGKGWRLLVAIADVGHYVPAGSALDAAACERGTSVYFPERVVPMLPEALSNGICSLRPGEDRLALVCDMQLNRAGAILDHRFYEAVIRSKERLTYAAVESIHRGGQALASSGVARSLAALFDAYRALRKARDTRGALDFEPFESVLELAGGAVKAIKPMVRLDSHCLIEEAMIAANICAAAFIERHGATALRRVHEPPDPVKIEPLTSAFKLIGVALPKEGLTAASLQRALQAAQGRPDLWLFEMLTLQAMQRAHYSPKRLGHFALALDRYAHFTSPIRRYPDLQVHRTIKALLRGRTNALPNQGALQQVGLVASMAERRAEDASRMVDAWLKCAYLAPRVGETFPAQIAGVTGFGLFAELKGHYIQGLLHISDLGGDYFQHVPPFHLVGETSGRSYRLGDAIEVRLAGVQPELGRLDLELADSPPSRRGAGRQRYRRRRQQAHSRNERRGAVRGRP